MIHDRILVIGGAGYIGSHICKALSEQGYEPITFDNLSNGHAWAVKWGPLLKGDIHSQEDLDEAFISYQPSAVIHLASHINVRESVQNPELYYYNNVSGSLSVLSSMVRHRVKSLVFSSSAAVYGNPRYTPVDEQHARMPLNPYGRTKSMVENLLEDFSHAYGLKFISLRYFNAAGADPENEIGEAHKEESHLIPRLLSASQSMRPQITIYGNTFPTPDGTAIRDYVHVSDIANAHFLAVEWLHQNYSSLVLNIGNGMGYSVLEVVNQVEKQTGRKISVDYERSSNGEPPILIANINKAARYLKWNPENSSLEFIVKTAWEWHQQKMLSPSYSLI